MTGPPHTILFDFDGTLAPNLDLPDMRRQVIELTRTRGVPDSAWTGRYIVEIIEASRDWMRSSGRADADPYFDEAHALITAIEMQAASDTRVFHWVPRLLGELRRQGICSTIVTRNCEAAVRTTFPDLEEHVDGLFARDSTPYLKPDPRHFTAAMQHTGALAEGVWVVSDGAMDMRTGRSLGLRCIGVLTGSNDRVQLIEAGADVVFEDARGLLRNL